MEATGASARPLPPAAHTAPRGIHRAPPAGSEPEEGLAHGRTAVYPVYTSRIQPWGWNSSLCSWGAGLRDVGQCDCGGQSAAESP